MSADGGLPKVTMLISAVAIIFAGIAAFVIMKWTDARTAAGEARLTIEELETAEAEIGAELGQREDRLAELETRSSVLINGKLVICNSSSEPVTVKLLAATYLTSDGAFEVFNSESLGDNLWRIGPGDREELTYSQGSTTWNGDVAYYAMWLLAGSDEYPFAGTWPANPNFCVRWTGA